MQKHSVRYHSLPRSVRPSFLTAEVDGLKSNIATGPKARSGRLSVELAVRVDGGIVDRFVTVDAIASRDGKTTLVRVSVCGQTVHEETVCQDAEPASAEGGGS